MICNIRNCELRFASAGMTTPGHGDPFGMNSLRNILAAYSALGLFAATLVPARAEDPQVVELRLKDHRFAPAEIHVPSGKRADLHVRNEDDTAEEFDSTALRVEKVIPAGSAATIHLHPLGPGRFPFMGEFHPDTAQGSVISE